MKLTRSHDINTTNAVENCLAIRLAHQQVNGDTKIAHGGITKLCILST
jgi:hypothetical protein